MFLSFHQLTFSLFVSKLEVSPLFQHWILFSSYLLRKLLHLLFASSIIPLCCIYLPQYPPEVPSKEILHAEVLCYSEVEYKYGIVLLSCLLHFTIISKTCPHKIFHDLTFPFFNSLLNVLKSDLCLLTYCFGGTHLCFSFSQHAAQLTVLSSFSFYSSLSWSTFSLSDHPSFSLAGHPLPPTSEWEWSPSFCFCSFSLCPHFSCSHKHFLKDLPNLSLPFNLLNACWSF